MTDVSRRPSAAGHTDHDLLSIAALADRQGTGMAAHDRRRAEALVDTCSECASLHRDLQDLDLVLPTISVPSRPRDFRLTEADARRLRPAGWRRWWRSIGSSSDTFTRPLALGLTTLGLVGLLLGTVPSFFSGLSGAASATAPADTSATGQQRGAAQAAPAASAAASAGPGYGAAELTPASTTPLASARTTVGLPAYPDAAAMDSGDGGAFIGQGGVDPSSSDSAPAAVSPIDQPEVGQAGSTVPSLILLAGGLLLAGLVLFALRWSGRRV